MLFFLVDFSLTIKPVHVSGLHYSNYAVELITAIEHFV